MLDGDDDGVVVDAGHMEFPRGPVCRTRVVGEACLGDLDPCFCQFEGLLSPVDFQAVRRSVATKVGKPAPMTPTMTTTMIASPRTIPRSSRLRRPIIAALRGS